MRNFVCDCPAMSLRGEAIEQLARATTASTSVSLDTALLTMFALLKRVRPIGMRFLYNAIRTRARLSG